MDYRIGGSYSNTPLLFDENQLQEKRGTVSITGVRVTELVVDIEDIIGFSCCKKTSAVHFKIYDSRGRWVFFRPVYRSFSASNFIKKSIGIQQEAFGNPFMILWEHIRHLCWATIEMEFH